MENSPENKCCCYANILYSVKDKENAKRACSKDNREMMLFSLDSLPSLYYKQHFLSTRFHIRNLTLSIDDGTMAFKD
ncbi:hypothetical protein QQP08_027543 [Theobroma cacao]|nr:hypothetical protein QQP08_027543 [Theobroma cacao]